MRYGWIANGVLPARGLDRRFLGHSEARAWVLRGCSQRALMCRCNRRGDTEMARRGAAFEYEARAILGSIGQGGANADGSIEEEEQEQEAQEALDTRGSP